MKKSIRVLVAEDSEDDTILTLNELKEGGYDPVFERVETSAAMKAALDQNEWDCVICDYSMPSFNALAALTLLKESGNDLPFIIVSGTIGEDTAVEAMRAGAHDYIIKGKLQRLVPAIERELRETQIRSERKQAEESLRESEERYRLLFESNPLPMFVYNIETLRFVGVNDAAVEHYGYARDEFLAMTIKDIRSPEELPRLEANLSGPSQPQERSGPWKHRKKDGTLIDVEIISHEIMFLNRPARLVLANDITELKRAEEERRKSEERFKKAIEDIFKFVPEAVLVFTRSLNVYKHNKAFEDTVQKYAQKLNYAEEELADLIIKQVAERLAESNGTEIRIPRKEG